MTDELLVSGRGGGVPGATVTGRARVVKNAMKLADIKDGDIIVTEMTDVDFLPAMGKAAAVVTNLGGIICHAAIVCAELGVPFVVGTGRATHAIKDNSVITVNVDSGEVRAGDGAK